MKKRKESHDDKSTFRQGHLISSFFLKLSKSFSLCSLNKETLNYALICPHIRIIYKTISWQNEKIWLGKFKKMLFFQKPLF